MKKKTEEEKLRVRREANSRYYATPEGKAAVAQYRARLENKEKAKKVRSRYFEKPENRKKARETHARHMAKPEVKEKKRVAAREANRAARLEMIAQYGGECRCCGEKEYEFLAIDHINNDGAEDRKKMKGSIASSLKKLGWPKSNYQLLCHNCNLSKGFYGGECIHKRVTVI